MNILLAQRRWGHGEWANNPIALLDLAPIARTMGEVDCHWLGELPNKEYHVVGFSVLMDYPEVMTDISRLRKKYRRATMVVGGKWAQRLDEERSDELRAMNVTLWKCAGEEYFGYQVRPEQPSWDARDLETLHVHANSLMSARGCPYHCAFCNNTEPKIIRFSAKRTIDNVELLFARGVKRVFFVDDVFTSKADHMVGIYEEAQKRKVPLVGRNVFFTHVNHINDRTTKAMRLFNPRCVQIGIESGDDGMLKAMDKGFTVEKAHDRLRFLSQSVGGVMRLFMIGFPGETVDSLCATKEFVVHAAPFMSRIWISQYQPIPGTKGYDMALEQGRIISTGVPNTRISYIDNNLTAPILRGARVTIKRAYKQARRELR